MAKNTISTPIKDGVMADNSTLSSNEITKRIDEATASILPEVSGSDEGKVLTVGSDGSWKAAPVPEPHTGAKVVVIECTDNTITSTECAKIVEALNDNALVIAKITSVSTSAYQNLTIPFYVIMAFDSSSTSAYFTLKGYTINTLDLQNATIIYLTISGGEAWGQVSFETLNA